MRNSKTLVAAFNESREIFAQAPRDLTRKELETILSHKGFNKQCVQWLISHDCVTKIGGGRNTQYRFKSTPLYIGSIDKMLADIRKTYNYVKKESKPSDIINAEKILLNAGYKLKRPSVTYVKVTEGTTEEEKLLLKAGYELQAPKVEYIDVK